LVSPPIVPCLYIGEGPTVDIAGEATLGRADAALAIHSARLSPMQLSDSPRSDSLLDSSDRLTLSGSKPRVSPLAGKNKTQPHTWSITFIDYEEIYIDSTFGWYMGGSGDAHVTHRIDDDKDDNIGLQDADLTFDDCSVSSSSSATSTTAASTSADSSPQIFHIFSPVQ
jgi:hypothetical protein